MDETALPILLVNLVERGGAEKLLAEPDPQAQNASP
jgi:hypothetical protein